VGARKIGNTPVAPGQMGQNSPSRWIRQRGKSSV